MAANMLWARIAISVLLLVPFPVLAWLDSVRRGLQASELTISALMGLARALLMVLFALFVLTGGTDPIIPQGYSLFAMFTLDVVLVVGGAFSSLGLQARGRASPGLSSKPLR